MSSLLCLLPPFAPTVASSNGQRFENIKDKKAMKLRPSIPICRPLLPVADDVVPYLRRIDTTRIYSNFGPLAREFESRFVEACDIPALELVTCTNCTLAIQAALIAKLGSAPKPRPLCLVPAFTFAATVSAVISAGLTPAFIDVDPVTGMIDVEALMGDPILERTSAVIVVGAFGRMPDLAALKEFERKAGVAVIVDAAGSTDALLSGTIKSLEGLTVALSFHATKAFGIGEGGAIALEDGDLAFELRTLTNFGFDRDRVATRPGFNGKMPEYSAAIGLALLDQWPLFRERYKKVISSYERHFARPQLRERFWMEQSWITTYPHLLAVSDAERCKIASALEMSGVESRRWWGEGCHRHPAYSNLIRNDLSHTECWIKRLVGLPFFIDLADSQIDRIAQIAAESLSIGEPTDEAKELQQ